LRGGGHGSITAVCYVIGTREHRSAAVGEVGEDLVVLVVAQADADGAVADVGTVSSTAV
jgi:hypothetical protein